ncbi:hypothetical protein [Sphaerotilus mobilis]|nr:hypothetical protein [Sphaerotilus mobilis]
MSAKIPSILKSAGTLLISVLLTACGGGEETGTSSSTTPISNPITTPGTTPTTGPGVSSTQQPRWTTPLLLETSNSQVELFSNVPRYWLGISDSGDATVAFIQADATGRRALQVTRGNSDTNWSEPTVIDAAAPIDVGDYPFSGSVSRPDVAVSPNGNAVVAWAHLTDCGTGSYLKNPADPCSFVYASRRLAGESNWEAPIRVSDSPYGVWGPHRVKINDRGDVAILFAHAEPTETTARIDRPGVALRTATESAFRVEVLNDWPIAYGFATGPELHRLVILGLDETGHVNVTGQRGTDIVSYRGSVASGFGSVQVAAELESRAATASLFAVHTGSSGYIATLWLQDTATTAGSVLLSVFSPTTQSWTPSAVPIDLTQYLSSGALTTANSLSLFSTSKWALRVTDDSAGHVLIYDRCTLTQWKAGAVIPKKNLPSLCGLHLSDNALFVFNQKGDYVGVNASGYDGGWVSYNQSTNSMTHTMPANLAGVQPQDYVLGTRTRIAGSFPTVMDVSNTGKAILVTSNRYATLPSASGPIGDLHPSLYNLWGLFLH